MSEQELPPSDLERFRQSVEGLRGEVGTLNGQLEQMAEERRREASEGAIWRKRANRRLSGFVIVTVVLLGLLAAFVGYVEHFGQDTDSKFNAFRDATFKNCQLRNQQSDGQRVFINFLARGVHDADTKQAVDAFLKSIPVDADCTKLLGGQPTPTKSPTG